MNAWLQGAIQKIKDEHQAHADYNQRQVSDFELRAVAMEAKRVHETYLKSAEAASVLAGTQHQLYNSQAEFTTCYQNLQTAANTIQDMTTQHHAEASGFRIREARLLSEVQSESNASYHQGNEQ